MIMAKRIFLIFLAAMMAAGVLACANGGEPDAATSAESIGETAPPIDYENLSLLERLQIDYNSVPDDLPDSDYGGYIFRIHTTARSSDILGDPDNTSEVVGDAVYKRRIEIEDRFNVKIETYNVDYNGDYYTYVKLMNSIFLSQEDAFDLMTVWNTTSGVFTKQNFLTDLTQIETIDFEKPWFFKKAIDGLSYKDHAFVSVDLMQVIYGSLTCVFFNKQIAADMNVDDLYDTVRSGNWTLGIMQAIIKDMWVDLNGNGTVERNDDQFGLNAPIAQFSYAFMPALNCMVVSKDQDDIPYLTASENSERITEVYTNMRSFFNETPSVTYDDWGKEVFIGGRALFLTEFVGTVNELRDTKFEYGILPCFKYDDTQQDYYTGFLPEPTAIPVTCTDMERSGTILSAYAAGGYKKVSIAYFETAVKTKYTADEDSAEMLDIIAGNVVSDGTVMFTDSMIYTFLTFAKSKNEFSSFWASQEKAAQKYLDDLMTTLDGFIA